MLAAQLPPPADEDTVSAPVGGDQPETSDLGRHVAPATPRPRSKGPPEPPYRSPGPLPAKHGPSLPVVIVGAVLLAILIAVAGCFGVTQLTASDSEKPARTAPTTSWSASPTANETNPPQPSEQSPSLPAQPTSPTPPLQSAEDSPGAVVESYFAAINSGDYKRAWALGGRNLQPGSFSSFAKSFEGTVSESLTVLSASGDEVEIELDATQTDGTHRYFAGTYTVQSGVIVAADIEQQ